MRRPRLQPLRGIKTLQLSPFTSIIVNINSITVPRHQFILSTRKLGPLLFVQAPQSLPRCWRMAPLRTFLQQHIVLKAVV